jgi:Saxitoxin biosynthesis operon protein SxtJ
MRTEPSLWRLMWDGWNAYAHRAGGYQAQVLLTLVYFLVLGPSALVARLFGNHLLDLDHRPRPSYWIERETEPPTLASLERQF